MLSSWPRSLREFTRFIWWIYVEQCQVAADPQTKPPDLGCESACFRQLLSTSTICHLLLLLIPKADTHLPSHHLGTAEKVHTAQWMTNLLWGAEPQTGELWLECHRQLSSSAGEVSTVCTELWTIWLVDCSCLLALTTPPARNCPTSWSHSAEKEEL